MVWFTTVHKGEERAIFEAIILNLGGPSSLLVFSNFRGQSLPINIPLFFYFFGRNLHNFGWRCLLTLIYNKSFIAFIDIESF